MNNMAKYIDHTILNAKATKKDIQRIFLIGDYWSNCTVLTFDIAFPMTVIDQVMEKVYDILLLLLKDAKIIQR